MNDIQTLPTWPQSQKSVAEQMADVVVIANRLGMYDAADAIVQMSKNLPNLKYGCHCDLEPHMEPDECVLDNGEGHCIYAKEGMRKEQCKYWRIIKEVAP